MNRNVHKYLDLPASLIKKQPSIFCITTSQWHVILLLLELQCAKRRFLFILFLSCLICILTSQILLVSGSQYFTVAVCMTNIWSQSASMLPQEKQTAKRCSKKVAARSEVTSHRPARRSRHTDGETKTTWNISNAPNLSRNSVPWRSGNICEGTAGFIQSRPTAPTSVGEDVIRCLGVFGFQKLREEKKKGPEDTKKVSVIHKS